MKYLDWSRFLLTTIFPRNIIDQTINSILSGKLHNNWRVKSVSVLCEDCPFFMKKCENCAMSQSSLTSIKKHSDKRVRNVLSATAWKGGLWLVHIYVHGPSLAALMCTDALSTHRVTLLNDVISYTIFYWDLKITQCFMVKTQFVCHNIFLVFFILCNNKARRTDHYGFMFSIQIIIINLNN